MMLVLGEGEGAVPLERPSFSVLNFCSRAYFHLWQQQKKSPETSPFYSFCRSGDHHFQNLYTCKPFHRHPRPIDWRSWTQNDYLALHVCMGLQLGRVPAIRFLHISSRDPPFHVWACSRAPHLHAWACYGALQFHARLAPKPPFFTLLWHRPTTIWAKVPSPSTLMLAWKFWIKIMLWKNNTYDSLTGNTIIEPYTWLCKVFFK